MPIYKISIILKPDSSNPSETRQEVFRQYREMDIEIVWHKLENKCRLKWDRRLQRFDCVMISKRSADYKRYLMQVEKAGKGKGMTEMRVVRPDEPQKKEARGPGKYRNL